MERDGPSQAEAEQTTDKHALAGGSAAWESQAALTTPLCEVFAAEQVLPQDQPVGLQGLPP